MLRRADAALMRAKQQGRDRVVLHDSVGSASYESRDGVVTIVPPFEPNLLAID